MKNQYLWYSLKTPRNQIVNDSRSCEKRTNNDAL